ncbi:MAG TPA: CBS domain-containing protein [Acidimicrobiales bacterium]|nr:CBS domain-containing protein [Acidimicrobiales bacterium]
MHIVDILDVKGSTVATIDGAATVGDAVAELARRSIGALVVTADGVHIDGIVSERDIVRLLHRDRHALTDQPVRAIMSSPVHTCGPDDEVEAIMATMTNRRVRHLPVVSDGALVGLVSIGDVVKSRIQELEEDHKILVEYITAR